MVQIKVPAVLAADGASTTVEVGGDTLADAFENHAAEHGPELRDSIIENGQIKEFINIYVDGEEVNDLAEPVTNETQVRVIPAASGG